MLLGLPARGMHTMPSVYQGVLEHTRYTMAGMHQCCYPLHEVAALPEDAIPRSVLWESDTGTLYHISPQHTPGMHHSGMA